MMVYVALDRFPRNRFNAPAVPACAEETNPGNCQHSNIELPLAAEMAVRFRLGVVVLTESVDGGHDDDVEVVCANMRVVLV